MRVAPILRHVLVMVMIQISRCWEISPGTAPTAREKPIRSTESCKTRGIFLTCMEMFMNGAWITTSKEPHMLEELTREGRSVRRKITGFFAEELTTSTNRTPGLQAAISAQRDRERDSADFVLFWVKHFSQSDL